MFGLLWFLFVTVPKWLISALVIIRFYIEMSMGLARVPKDKRLDGKIALITGGTAGIGYETALEFAKRGATIILAARDAKKGQQVVELLKKLTGNTNITFLSVDMATIKGTKKFAEEFLKKHDKLNYLINNAGLVGDPGWKKKKDKSYWLVTEEGNERTVSANYLSHVILTEALLPTLITTGKADNVESRIVNVSSMANFFSKLDVSKPDFLNNHKDKILDEQYNISKLCQVIYTKQLGERLIKNGDDKYCVTSSLHPGAVRTSIFRESTDSVISMIIKVTFTLLGKNCWQGAQTTIWAALSDEAKGLNGLYLSDCRKSRFYQKKLVDEPEIRQKVMNETRKLIEKEIKDISGPSGILAAFGGTATKIVTITETETTTEIVKEYTKKDA